MKLSPVTSFGLALAFLLGFNAPTHAEFVPWMYNWSRSPNEIHADAPGTGYVSLTDESLRGAVGDSDIVATNLRTFSSAPPTNPDHFTAKAYSLSLFLLDINSGLSGTMTFTGQLDGTMTAQSSMLRNTFTGETTQTLVLGNHRYTATIGPYSPPGVPGSENSGSISAHAMVQVENIVQTPEPATALLASLGAIVVAVTRRRRVRSGRAGA